MSLQATPEMAYRQLGKSGLHISCIGFGGMSLSSAQEDARWLIDQALDHGINYFDTADIYEQGANEIMLGKALRERRDKVVIATKVGNQLRPGAPGWDWNPTKAYILQAVDASLQRLQTDCIDLYQLHGGTIDDAIDETIEAFEILQQLGKIRYYGISSIRPNVIREYVKRSNMVSVMMQYSLLDRRPEEACFQLLKAHQIGVLARGTVAGGLLAGKPAQPYLNYTEEEVSATATAIKMATPPNRLPAATAIGFVLQQPPVTAAVVGIRTAKHLEGALEATGNHLLTSAQMQGLRAATQPALYELHR